MKYSISLDPITQHLEEIEKWLIAERDTNGEGFYCNWTIIKNFYARNELVVLLVDNKPVGFCCWRKTSNLSGQINIFEIRPDYRGKGLGLSFTNKLLAFFVSKNIYVVDLQCVPENSESFWRKLGFIDVPPSIHFWDKQTTHLFKRLVPYQQQVQNHNGYNYIEIWDLEPYAAKNRESKWKWDLNITNEKKISLPIIQPCEQDWRIKFVQGGKVIIDDKIKRFGNIEIYNGPYAIITELPSI